MDARPQPPEPQGHEMTEPPGAGLGDPASRVAELKPLDVTGVRTVMVGTLLWLVAGLALLPFRGWLEDHGHVWWLYTCAAGFGLGLFGFDHCRRRARHLGEKLPLEDKLRRSG